MHSDHAGPLSIPGLRAKDVIDWASVMKKPSALRNPLDSKFTQRLPSQELSILLQVSSTLAASLDLDQVL